MSAGLVGDDDELDAVAGVELGQQAAHVGAGGGGADHQAGGDLVVGQPAADEREHLPLARGEDVEARRGHARLRAARELGDEPAGHRGREQRLAAGDEGDRADEVGGLAVLEQEPRRPGAQGAVDVLVEVEGGQHEHRGAGQRGVGDDRVQGGQAVDARHPHVHDDHVGTGLAGDRHGLRAVGRLADHREALLGLEQDAQAGADQLLVVGQHHTDHRGGRPRQAGARPPRRNRRDPAPPRSARRAPRRARRGPAARCRR